MKYNEPKLYYENSVIVNGTITNYKPPVPVFKLISNKPLNGNLKFQHIGKGDTTIKFSIAFNISDCGKDEYKKFLRNYSKQFTFVDEWGDHYVGRLKENIEINNPIEGDIYYVSVEMICNCEI